MRVFLINRAENVAVLLLTAMFFIFILQVAFRYVVKQPLGWTLEACLLAWLWIVFWGAAFLLEDRDHVRFDILFVNVRPRIRRWFAVISAVALIAAFCLALPATWDYITFMKIESTSLLKIRFDWVFSIYMLFSFAIIIRYASRIVRIFRDPDYDPSAVTIRRDVDDC